MRVFTYAFSALLAAGGTFAFVKKGSAKSLGAGLGAALILFLCARSMVAGAQGPARVAFGICLLLGITMANRFNNTKKFVPPGLLATIALGMAFGFVAVGL
ncbi:hypothetical protein HYH03_010801 [Edaphochlamys debaryana]|uniref:Uncharacterized protein n=1 Tax=Edaphochlamys debaryana TaxID=47281 RepID=A0A836BX77_9CHLO|nr:hypothetical protein HYH03_010801 [Edaphochlamys debaryana]|eukprot:KAG2490884.1 hypothetical protein HYH03_010801 [Edaphochlamys debaryana]